MKIASAVFVASSDKNLSDVLLSRSRAPNTSLALLDALQCMAKNTISHYQRYGHVPQSQASDLLSRIGSTHVGGFRIRPKIHKPTFSARVQLHEQLDLAHMSFFATCLPQCRRLVANTFCPRMRIKCETYSLQLVIARAWCSL